jgi:hypothetical protein
MLIADCRLLIEPALNQQSAINHQQFQEYTDDFRREDSQQRWFIEQ